MGAGPPVLLNACAGAQGRSGWGADRCCIRAHNIPRLFRFCSTSCKACGTVCLIFYGHLHKPPRPHGCHRPQDPSRSAGRRTHNQCRARTAGRALAPFGPGARQEAGARRGHSRLCGALGAGSGWHALLHLCRSVARPSRQRSGSALRPTHHTDGRSSRVPPHHRRGGLSAQDRHARHPGVRGADSSGTSLPSRTSSRARSTVPMVSTSTPSCLWPEREDRSRSTAAPASSTKGGTHRRPPPTPTRTRPASSRSPTWRPVSRPLGIAAPLSRPVSTSSPATRARRRSNAPS